MAVVLPLDINYQGGGWCPIERFRPTTY